MIVLLPQRNDLTSIIRKPTIGLLIIRNREKTIDAQCDFFDELFDIPYPDPVLDPDQNIPADLVSNIWI